MIIRSNGHICGWFACATLLITLSCSNNEEDTSTTVVSRTILADGVEMLSYSRFPDTQLPMDTLATINPWSDETGYLFSSIRRITGGYRSLYILDSRSREIVQLGLDGMYIRSFGGEGEGPGEFNSPTQMVMYANELHAADSRLRRISVFSDEGVFLRSYRWPAGITTGLGQFSIGPGGSMYTMFSPVPFDTSPQVYWTLVRCHPDGAAADTLLTMNADKSTALELFSESGKRIPVFTTPIFAPYLWWAVSGDHLLTVSTLDYQIEFRDAAGQLLRVLKGPGEPLEVTPAIRNRWLADGFVDTPYGSLFKQLNESPDMESLKALPFAQQRQSIIGLAVDPLRRIWALSSTGDPSVNRLDIFTSNGDYLGHLGNMGIPATFLEDGTPVYTTFDSDNYEIFLIMTVPLSGE